MVAPNSHINILEHQLTDILLPAKVPFPQTLPLNQIVYLLASQGKRVARASGCRLSPPCKLHAL